MPLTGHRAEIEVAGPLDVDGHALGQKQVQVDPRHAADPLHAQERVAVRRFDRGTPGGPATAAAPATR